MSENVLAPEWLVHPDDANALAAQVWPMNAARTASGVLSIDGVEATQLAREFGTPLYVVDEADVRARAAAMKQAFDDAFAGKVKVYYAGKAFLSTEVARWVTDAGLNIDVCSGGELAVALAAGVDPARLGMHGNNKSHAEIDRCVELGVGAIVLDSVVEVDRVAAAARRHGTVQNVRLRVNSGVHASTHEYLATAREDQKFGIPLSDVPDVVAQIRAHDSLRFLGLHSHIGSQIFESDGFAEAAWRLLTVHAGLLGGWRGPRAEPRRGFRHRVHERRRGDSDRADRCRLRAGRDGRVRGARHRGACGRDRAGARDRRAVDGDAVRGGHRSRTCSWEVSMHPTPPGTRPPRCASTSASTAA